MRFLSWALMGCQLVLPTIAQTAISTNATYQLSTDSEFAFVLEVVLALANGGGASTGEVLRIASQIQPGNFESWYKEFMYLGNAIHEKAVAINATRFPVSARDAYFRSSSYYRYAPFFLHQNQTDPRIDDVVGKSVSDFKKGAALLPIPAINLNLPAKSPNVPSGNFTVPARFFKAQRSNEKVPTVIIGTGYDGSQEDLYHEIGIEVLKRGWNVITYEGPGQPTVLREQKIGFIPDWWNVVSPVVDYLETRKDVDLDAVALVGVSFGGQLAPLAATREHRLSAVVAVDGMNDLYGHFLEEVPKRTSELYEKGQYEKFDEIFLGLEKTQSTAFRWAIAQSLFSFNTTSPSSWWGRMPAFTLNATRLQEIECPVFIGEGENDSSAPGQAAFMAKALGKKATYNLFKTDVGAGEHCQLGAEFQLAQVSLDWLGETWAHVDLPRNLTNKVY